MFYAVDPTSLNYCAVSSGKNSPNPTDSTSPSHTSSQNNNINSCTTSRRLDPRARESLGQHLIELLATLVLPEPPQSIGEVDTRLSDGLPSIPDKLMPSESDSERYRNIAEKGRKKGLRLPVEKIYLAFKVSNSVLVPGVSLQPSEFSYYISQVFKSFYCFS